MASQPISNEPGAPAWRPDPRWLAIGLVVLLMLGGAYQEVHALTVQRDELTDKLAAERSSHLRDRDRMRALEQEYANFRLESQVRRDFVDERMARQDKRQGQLDAQAEAVRVQKLAEANCITPKSILNAVGL